MNKPGLVWVARFFGVVKKPIFPRFSFLIVSRWLWSNLPWAVFLSLFCFWVSSAVQVSTSAVLHAQRANPSVPASEWTKSLGHRSQSHLF